MLKQNKEKLLALALTYDTKQQDFSQWVYATKAAIQYYRYPTCTQSHADRIIEVAEVAQRGAEVFVDECAGPHWQLPSDSTSIVGI